MSEDEYKGLSIKRIFIDKIKDKKSVESTNLMIEFNDVQSSDSVRSYFKNINSMENTIIQFIPLQSINRWKNMMTWHIC